MATDDRERLEAIANAIMAPHVANQQQVGEKIRRRREHRLGWFRRHRVVIALSFLAYSANLLWTVLHDGQSDLWWFVLLVVAAVIASVAWARKH